MSPLHDPVRISPLDTSSPTLIVAATTLIANAFANPERYGQERIKHELSSPPPPFYRQFFIAEQSGTLVGLGGIKAADWSSKTHILYLSAVAAEHRGQGIGRALIAARLEWISAHFKSGRILVSAGKTRRFRDFGFRPIRNSRIDGRQLMLKRF